jgi:hypothetical protein
MQSQQCVKFEQSGGVCCVNTRPSYQPRLYTRSVLSPTHPGDTSGHIVSAPETHEEQAVCHDSIVTSRCRYSGVLRENGSVSQLPFCVHQFLPVCGWSIVACAVVHGIASVIMHIVQPEGRDVATNAAAIVKGLSDPAYVDAHATKLWETCAHPMFGPDMHKGTALTLLDALTGPETPDYGTLCPVWTCVSLSAIDAADDEHLTARVKEITKEAKDKRRAGKPPPTHVLVMNIANKDGTPIGVELEAYFRKHGMTVYAAVSAGMLKMPWFEVPLGTAVPMFDARTDEVVAGTSLTAYFSHADVPELEVVHKRFLLGLVKFMYRAYASQLVSLAAARTKNYVLAGMDSLQENLPYTDAEMNTRIATHFMLMPFMKDTNMKSFSIFTPLRIRTFKCSLEQSSTGFRSEITMKATAGVLSTHESMRSAGLPCDGMRVFARASDRGDEHTTHAASVAPPALFIPFLADFRISDLNPRTGCIEDIPLSEERQRKLEARFRAGKAFTAIQAWPARVSLGMTGARVLDKDLCCLGAGPTTNVAFNVNPKLKLRQLCIMMPFRFASRPASRETQSLTLNSLYKKRDVASLYGDALLNGDDDDDDAEYETQEVVDALTQAEAAHARAAVGDDTETADEADTPPQRPKRAHISQDSLCDE